MVFGNIIPSQRGTLSLHQALDLANVYLESVYRTQDRDVALVLCHDAENALSQAKRVIKKYTNDQLLRDRVATAYIDLGKYLGRQGYHTEATSICKKAEKWGGSANNPGRLAQQSRPTSMIQLPDEASTYDKGLKDTKPVQESQLSKIKQRPTVALIATHIFSENVRPQTTEHKLPQPDERLSSTPQLVCCLGLLQASHSPGDIIETDAHKWLQVIEKDADEQERLHALSKDVIRAFKRDELKDAKAIAEVVCLVPVLNKETYHDLLREFYSGIDHSGLLNCDYLEGIAQLIQGADPGHLNADDLIKILGLLSTRLMNTHRQSTHHMHQLSLAVSHVLDAMADTKVTGINREKLHEPLSTYLGDLEKSKDPFLVYQAAYAYQALLCVPDNETAWQAATRRRGKVIKGVTGLVSAAKGFDLERFINGLTDIQEGLGGVSKVIEVVKTGYEGVTSLEKSGQGFVKCLKEGSSFERQREWYAALRGADTLIRDGELATFQKLVCGAPCRYDPAFQWGVCQRLGEMAANPTWDAVTRRSAITFLGEIYRDDDMWGQHPNVKQWILNILMQLSATNSYGPSSGIPHLHAIVAKTLLENLEVCDDPKKQELYHTCRENGPTAYPLKITLPQLGSPSLLDQVQNRPDVEGNIRVLTKQRTKERESAVYIPPQAKPNFQSSDDTRFPLMEKSTHQGATVDEFDRLPVPLLTQEDWVDIDAKEGDEAQEQDDVDAKSAVEEQDRVSGTDDTDNDDDVQSSIVDSESVADVDSIFNYDEGRQSIESESDLEPPVDALEPPGNPDVVEKAPLDADVALQSLKEATMILEFSKYTAEGAEQAWIQAEKVIEDFNERLEVRIMRHRDDARERQESYEQYQRDAWEQWSKWRVCVAGRKRENENESMDRNGEEWSRERVDHRGLPE